MLGWFKKKFGKKEEEQQLTPDIPPQEVEATQPLAEPVQTARTEQASLSPKREEPPHPIPKDAPAPEHEATTPDPDIPAVPEQRDAPESAAEPAAPPSGEPTSSDSRKQQPDSELATTEETATPPREEPTASAPKPAGASSPLKVAKKAEHEASKTEKKKSLFSRLSTRLAKTRESFTYQMDALFLGKREISAELLDDLEEILITADLGVSTTQDLLEHIRRKVGRKELTDARSLHQALQKRISQYILDNEVDATLVMPDDGPFVIMVIGVNGVGKTTTIGKIANKFKQAGSSVMLVAADTFRAAAINQLKIWGERNSIPVVAHKEGSDPSSVVYDALAIAQSKKIDVVLVDTAGRLHTQVNLMEELKKIKRVMGKRLPGAPHEVMLVVDATTGQNGISQAKLFNEAVDVTGITLTKLDGTSKGGIVVNICRELQIPIRFIGIGEKLDDLRDFDAAEFAEALFQSRDSRG